MTGENGYPVTPEWQLPRVEEPKVLQIPPNIELGSE